MEGGQIDAKGAIYHCARRRPYQWSLGDFRRVGDVVLGVTALTGNTTMVDLYVGLVGFRYGSTVPNLESFYSELEFDEATARGIKRLVFLLHEDARTTASSVYVDRGAVNRFRRRLMNADVIVGRFRTPEGLELAVYQRRERLHMAKKFQLCAAVDRRS